MKQKVTSKMKSIQSEVQKEAKRIHSLFWNYDHYWTLNKKSFEQAKTSAMTAVKLMMKEYKNAVEDENGNLFLTSRYNILKALPQAILALKYEKK